MKTALLATASLNFAMATACDCPWPLILIGYACLASWAIVVIGEVIIDRKASKPSTKPTQADIDEWLERR